MNQHIRQMEEARRLSGKLEQQGRHNYKVSWDADGETRSRTYATLPEAQEAADGLRSCGYQVRIDPY